MRTEDNARVKNAFSTGPTRTADTSQGRLSDLTGITSNAVFKAVTIKEWVSDPANASLETSNYLYYPAMPLFYRLLDMIGVFP